MTAHVHLAVGITVTAGISCVAGQDTLLQTYQAVYQLEHRSRGLGTLHGAVEHRVVWVLADFLVVFVDFRQLAYVDAGAGNQCQNLAS